jgi:hypothetical protein
MSPFFGVKRTSLERASMSVNSPTQTLGGPHHRCGIAAAGQAWAIQEDRRLLNKWSAHMTRYMVRRQENRKFCVWDTEMDKLAEEAGGDLRYMDLELDKALDCAGSLNRDKAKNSN